MKSIDFLKNVLINSYNDSEAITVKELIDILNKEANLNAKIFIYDSGLKCDLPLTKDDIYLDESEDEIYFFDE